MNLYLSTYTDGEEHSTDCQESALKTRGIPHVIKDFISSLNKNIRNKIANKWAGMRQPPSAVQKAFKLVSDMEKQLQMADSFKLEFSSYPAVEVNEMSAEELFRR